MAEFDPEEIILFGSCAGGARPDSDYDLMVILQEQESDPARIQSSFV